MDELDLRIRNRVYASFVRDGTLLTPVEAAAGGDVRRVAVDSLGELVFAARSSSGSPPLRARLRASFGEVEPRP